MDGRYDQSELNVYGAEDDFEMDTILGALEATTERATANELEPAGPDWKRLLAAPRCRADTFVRTDAPAEPGVYLWLRDNDPQYVGTATSLRKRLSTHLGGGASLAGSSLRRNVCELLFQIPPSVTGNPTRQRVTSEQAAAIQRWLRGCELSWVRSRSAGDAAAMETRLRRAFRPPLNRM